MQPAASCGSLCLSSQQPCAAHAYRLHAAALPSSLCAKARELQDAACVIAMHDSFF